MKFKLAIVFSVIATLLIPNGAYPKSDLLILRVGHFPNITHAPALVGRANKNFETSLKDIARVEWKLFNAGPEAIEALAVGAIDILYVGPNPAVNGFVRSKGELLRIVSGVASAGAAFVVTENSGIKKFEDIRGKRVATPQIGNTQDVALRSLMTKNHIKSKTQGGDVEIFNLSGADQLTAFLKNQIDAAWAVEPWVSRLTSEANGKILFEEKELWENGIYATTVLVVRKKFLDQNPEVAKKWVREHVEIVRWIRQNQNEAKQIVNDELKRETGKGIPEKYLDESFKRIEFTTDPMENSVRKSANRAFQVGFLGKNPIDLANLYDKSFLKE